VSRFGLWRPSEYGFDQSVSFSSAASAYTDVHTRFPAIWQVTTAMFLLAPTV
jgi:hypothetical protein